MGAPQRLILVTGIFLAVAAMAFIVVILGVDLPGIGVAPPGAGGSSEWSAADGPGGDSFEDEREFGRIDGPALEDEYLDPLDLLGDDGDADDEGGRKRGKRGKRRRKGEGAGPGDPDARAARARLGPDPGGKHVDLLNEVLDSGDPEKLRLFLVSTMSARGTELGEAEAAILIGALGEIDNPGLQSAILMHLERVGGDGVTEGLVTFLKDGPRSAVATRTIQALGRIGSVSAVSALVEAMNTPELGRARRMAADVLGRSRDPMVVGPLTASLGAADRETRRLAAAALVRVGTSPGLQAVLDYASTGDAADRAFGRRLIEKSIRGPAAVQVLGPALGRERDPALRVSVVRSLARSRDREATSYLVQAASRDENVKVRVEAVSALGRLRDASAYGDVQRIAKEDPHPAVKKAARRTLKRMEKR